MNEITKIHLGRQAFTVSVDAYHELRKYLDAIHRQVKDKDILDEIEMRMAELLTERGIDANKVILPVDVQYLKEQLGNPKDFSEDADEPSHTAPEKVVEGKRLFRDTDNAMIAGVAAGLGRYFGIDTLVIRILFVILVFITAGWGILLYIVLWLLVPEAKTTSDRLQMAGKPVTVDSLKEMVENADVNGAARRAGATVAGPLNRLLTLILRLIGVFFILAGLSIVFGLVTGGTYFIARHGEWLQGNIFPVGFREHLLLYIGMCVAAIFAVFIILVGVAIFRRKWPIRNWITGVLAGLFFIGLASGGALAIDVYPNIRDAYNANFHSTTRTVKAFKAISFIGPGVNVNYQTTSSYYVTLSYYGHPNLSTIKTTVDDHTLTINTSQFNWNRSCQALCIPRTYNVTLTIDAPNAMQLANQYYGFQPTPPSPPFLPKPTIVRSYH